MSWEEIEVIRIQNSYCRWDFLFGRFDCFGYYNSVSGTKRILSSLWVATLLTLLLWFLTCRFGEQISFNQLLLFLFSTSGLIYYFELQKLYQKWNYLANLFNSVVLTDPPKDKKKYDKRQHLNTCYAHDVLILGMWSHKSFKISFKYVLEEAVKLEFGEIYKERLEEIAKNGIKFQESKNLIGKLISELSPET